MLFHIELLRQYNKTADSFLKKKSKFSQITQQLKWCEIPPDSIDWKKVYESNYFFRIKTKRNPFKLD